jgi:excisionase family DNA binding protein
MAPTTETLLLDSPRAAELVGVSVGVLRGWVAQGLPFIRAGRGGRKLFTRKDLERWIEKQKEWAA